MTVDQSCLQYVLTEQEREFFNQQGYLIVENALTSEQVSDLIDAMDHYYSNRGKDSEKRFHENDFVAENELFLNLIDYPKTFPKVWGILGWNIYMYNAHLNVTSPSGKVKDNKTLGWHQDSGRTTLDLAESEPAPRLSLKVAYFLTDTTHAADCGNMWIIPGSHRNNRIELPPDRVGQPEGAMPVQVKPGTALFFDRRLWHSASPNYSTDYTRKALFFGYGYRWLRPKTEMMVEQLLEKTDDPIRKQLLGYGEDGNSFYRGKDDQVPLKVWLRKHCPEQVRP